MLRTAALATAGAVALGGVALLVPTAAGAVGAGAVSAAPDHGKHPALLTPAERQQLRSTGHLTVTVTLQRGDVTALSPTSISLTSKDGYSRTYRITDATKVRSHREDVPLSALKVGAKAQVVADGDTARRISFRTSGG